MELFLALLAGWFVYLLIAGVIGSALLVVARWRAALWSEREWERLRRLNQANVDLRPWWIRKDVL